MHQRFWREICGWNFRWVNPGIAKMISWTQMNLPFFQESQKGCEVSANLSSAVWKAMDLDCFYSKCLTSKKGIIWNAELPDMAPFDWEIENDHTKLPMALMTTKGVGPFWANGCQWTFSTCIKTGGFFLALLWQSAFHWQFCSILQLILVIRYNVCLALDHIFIPRFALFFPRFSAHDKNQKRRKIKTTSISDVRKPKSVWYGLVFHFANGYFMYTEWTLG